MPLRRERSSRRECGRWGRSHPRDLGVSSAASAPGTGSERAPRRPAQRAEILLRCRTGSRKDKALRALDSAATIKRRVFIFLAKHCGSCCSRQALPHADDAAASGLSRFCRGRHRVRSDWRRSSWRLPLDAAVPPRSCGFGLRESGWIGCFVQATIPRTSLFKGRGTRTARGDPAAHVSGPCRGEIPSDIRADSFARRSSGTMHLIARAAHVRPGVRPRRAAVIRQGLPGGAAGRLTCLQLLAGASASDR